MDKIFMLKRSLKWWLMVLLCCFFAGCGIKGPLHLPQDKKATSAPTEPASAPASQETTK